MSRTPVIERTKEWVADSLEKAQGGQEFDAGSLSSEIMRRQAELQSAASDDPIGVIGVCLSLVEGLPGLFMHVDDPRDLLSGTLAHVTRLIVDLHCDDFAPETTTVDRRGALGRIFELWFEDDTGYLSRLDECLLEMATTRADEEALRVVARRTLRTLPFAFPPRAGERLDLHRLLLIEDRYRVERLIGELLSRRGHHEYALLAARRRYEQCGDGLDLVACLQRSGQEEQALEIAERMSEAASTPRRAAAREQYRRLRSRTHGDERAVSRALGEFLDTPSRAAFLALKAVIPPRRRNKVCEEVLGELEKRGGSPDLCFELYVEEGLILEADALMTTHAITAETLAEAADRVCDTEPERAAGWWLMAAYRLLRHDASPLACRRAARWLSTVQQAAQSTGQAAGFRRAMADFKLHWGRSAGLLSVLADHGL